MRESEMVAEMASLRYELWKFLKHCPQCDGRGVLQIDVTTHADEIAQHGGHIYEEFACPFCMPARSLLPNGLITGIHRMEEDAEMGDGAKRQVICAGCGKKLHPPYSMFPGGVDRYCDGCFARVKAERLSAAEPGRGGQEMAEQVIQAGELFVLTQGEYSSYGILCACRPLKELRTGDMVGAFLDSAFVKEHGLRAFSATYAFIAWLIREGYAEEVRAQEWWFIEEGVYREEMRVRPIAEVGPWRETQRDESEEEEQDEGAGV